MNNSSNHIWITDLVATTLKKEDILPMIQQGVKENKIITLNKESFSLLLNCVIAQNTLKHQSLTLILDDLLKLYSHLFKEKFIINDANKTQKDKIFFIIEGDLSSDRFNTDFLDFSKRNKNIVIDLSRLTMSKNNLQAKNNLQIINAFLLRQLKASKTVIIMGIYFLSQKIEKFIKIKKRDKKEDKIFFYFLNTIFNFLHLEKEFNTNKNEFCKIYPEEADELQYKPVGKTIPREDNNRCVLSFSKNWGLTLNSILNYSELFSLKEKILRFHTLNSNNTFCFGEGCFVEFSIILELTSFFKANNITYKSKNKLINHLLQNLHSYFYPYCP